MTTVKPSPTFKGEDGLGGEIRHVGHMSRRLTEAARLGFTRAIVPTHSQSGAANKAPAGLTVQTLSTLSEALDLAQLSIKK